MAMLFFSDSATSTSRDYSSSMSTSSQNSECFDPAYKWLLMCSEYRVCPKGREWAFQTMLFFEGPGDRAFYNISAFNKHLCITCASGTGFDLGNENMIETRLLFGGDRSISAITRLYDKGFERLPHVHSEGGWGVSGNLCCYIYLLSSYFLSHMPFSLNSELACSLTSGKSSLLLIPVLSQDPKHLMRPSLPPLESWATQIIWWKLQLSLECKWPAQSHADNKWWSHLRIDS